MYRRKLVGASAALWLTAGHPVRSLAASGVTTPSQPEGPYYPVDTIPMRSDLTRREGRAAGGKLLLFSGVVLRAGKPVVGARVEIWQCDSQARYRHPASDLAGIDQGFEGYGAQITDAAGTYMFTTIEPVAYYGRPPHIHIRVKAADRVLLTTQAYLPVSNTGAPPPGMFSARGADPSALLMKIMPATPAGAAARFDILLA